jgi:flagellar FliL protein
MLLMKPAPPGAAQPPKKEHAKDKKKDEGKKGGKPGAEADVGEVREGPNGSSYYTLPDLVVNMDTADGRPTFLKLKVTFEISDADTVDLVQTDAPRLQDMFTAFLRELRPEDLAGSQGTYQLKAEILRRANLVLAPHKIDAVLIEEMLVQ